MHVPLAQGLDHRCGIGETSRIELVRAPIARPPMLPVDHHGVDRYAHRTVGARDAEHLILSLIMLAGLPKAPAPTRHQRRVARKPAIAGDDLVWLRPENEVI